MVQSAKQLANLKPIDNTDDYINEAKSMGHMYKNSVIRALRNGIAIRDIVNRTLDVVETELEAGNCKPALKLIEIAKETESNTTVNINQAVQVNKQDVEEAVKIINELR